jgi:hypothetical protein
MQQLVLQLSKKQATFHKSWGPRNFRPKNFKFSQLIWQPQTDSSCFKVEH